MSNVDPLPGTEVPPQVILDKAADWEMTKCLVIGINEDGDLMFGGSSPDPGWVSWTLLRALKFMASWMPEEG